MIYSNLQYFLWRYKFTINELSDDQTIGLQFADYFPPYDYLHWKIRRDTKRKFTISLLIGSYMSDYSMDDHDTFAKLLSRIDDEYWSFALNFCPFHKILSALENLSYVATAMDDAFLNLNTSLSGMEVAGIRNITKDGVFARQRSLATSSFLSFTSLYATYIDFCWRIRDLLDVPRDVHGRAIGRLIKKNSGMHAFFKSYRNFQMHYKIIEPEFQGELSRTPKSKLLLDSSDLLYSGFDWPQNARKFLESRRKIDLIECSTDVLSDVRRVIKFHTNIVHSRRGKEQFAYETYLRERKRQKHLLSAITDLSGALFRRPVPLLERLLDRPLIERVLQSSLTEAEMIETLTNLADRHKVLPPDVRAALDREIRKHVSKRPIYPSAGGYVDGRSLPSDDPD